MFLCVFFFTFFVSVHLTKVMGHFSIYWVITQKIWIIFFASLVHLTEVMFLCVCVCFFTIFGSVHLTEVMGFSSTHLFISQTLFCLFDLVLYVPVNNFLVKSGRVFLGLTSTKQRLMCLAQGHNTATPVRLETATPRSLGHCAHATHRSDGFSSIHWFISQKWWVFFNLLVYLTEVIFYHSINWFISQKVWVSFFNLLINLIKDFGYFSSIHLFIPQKLWLNFSSIHWLISQKLWVFHQFIGSSHRSYVVVFQLVGSSQEACGIWFWGKFSKYF